MRKEPIYKMTEKGEFVVEGFEILADFPYLLVNPKLDFATFKTHIEQINKENDSRFIYHLNIMMDTLKEKIDEIISLVKNSPVAKNIVIEILEEDIDEKTLENIISKLAENRIRISIDDFGTKSSNFDRLLKYKDIVESVKIDRVLWKNMPYVVKALVEDISINIIAEKVETKEELDKLASFGIKLFQGWYFKNNLKDLESKSASLDINGFEEEYMFMILKDAIKLLLRSGEERSIDNLFMYFKVIYLFYKLNIPLNGEEIDRIKKHIELSSNQKVMSSDETVKKAAKIVKYISGEVLYFIEEFQKIGSEISVALHEKDFDSISRNIYNMFNKLKVFSDSLKEKETELKLIELQLNGKQENVIEKANLKKMVLNSILESSRDLKPYVLIVNFPELEHIYSTIGYSSYEKSMKRILEIFRKIFPADTVVLNYDTSTFLVFLHQNQLKSINRLRKLFENTELLVDNKFINFKPNIGKIVLEKREGETIDDLVVRLEGKIYEVKHYGDEEDENSSMAVRKKT